MADAVLIVGAAAALLFADRRRGGAGAVALFIACFFIHWIFLGLFLLLLLGVALVLAPASLRAVRGGERPISTPSPRLLGVVLGTVAGTFAAFLLAPGFAVTKPVLTVESIEGKMASRIPALRLPLSGLLATGGAVALWWPRSALRRSGLALLGLWALSVPAALLGYGLLHHRFAAYRVAEFAIALPLLAGAAFVGLARVGWARFRVAGAVAGAAVLAAGVALTVITGWHAWGDESGIMLPARVQQVATAATYLRSVHAKGPVVFVVSTPALVPADRVIRAGVPGSLVPSVRIFDGRSQDLLAGRPTDRPPGSDAQANSSASWPAVRAVLHEPYIALYLSSFNPAFGPPDGATSLSPGLWLIKGPTPPAAIEAAPAPDPDPWRLASASVLVLLFLAVAGVGWTVSLLDVGWLARAALAPAVGAAAISLATIPLSHLAGPIVAAEAWAVYLALAAGGWVLLVIRVRMRTRGPGRPIPR
jgi:hypothetical protein